MAAPTDRDDVADAVVFQLLRCGALLMDVGPLRRRGKATSIGIDVTGVHRIDRGVIEARFVAGVLEHGERLPEVVDEDFLAGELAPGEIGVGFPRRDEKAVHLVDSGQSARKSGFPPRSSTR